MEKKKLLHLLLIINIIMVSRENRKLQKKWVKQKKKWEKNVI